MHPKHIFRGVRKTSVDRSVKFENHGSMVGKKMNFDRWVVSHVVVNLLLFRFELFEEGPFADTGVSRNIDLEHLLWLELVLRVRLSEIRFHII